MATIAMTAWQSDHDGMAVMRTSQGGVGWGTQRAFFWDYSRMRIHEFLGIDGNCVLLGPILIPE